MALTLSFNSYAGLLIGSSKTEYTVGENGPQAMPAQLPAASAYTYAVDLSVDEAIAAGAEQVTFSKPIPVYVENFLDFPVGIPVPLGYYDRQLGQWIAEDSGLVIKVLSIIGGSASLDIDGDDSPDNASSIGISSQELQRLADMATNTAGIVGIELLAAAQGVDLLRPLRTSEALEGVHATLRAVAAPYDADRYLAPDLQAAQRLVLQGAFTGLAGDLLPSWDVSP